MARAVDTCILLDVFLDDPIFGRASTECLVRYAAEGLVISPVTYDELAPAFRGDLTLQDNFLRKIGVRWREAWTFQDTVEAHAIWAFQIERKRLGLSGKRPVADVLIEAFAKRFQGLITRNPKHFKNIAIFAP